MNGSRDDDIRLRTEDYRGVPFNPIKGFFPRSIKHHLALSVSNDALVEYCCLNRL